MSKLPIPAFSLMLFFLVVSAVTAEENHQADQLFNGKDLSNWTWVTDKKGGTSKSQRLIRGREERHCLHYVIWYARHA